MKGLGPFGCLGARGGTGQSVLHSVASSGLGEDSADWLLRRWIGGTDGEEGVRLLRLNIN